MSIVLLKGKNAENNSKLIRESQPFDIWFHVSGQTSAHLILKNEKQEDIIEKLRKDGTIYRAALELKKSSSKFSKMNNISIDYCYIKYVKLTDVPGKVNISHFKTIKV